MSLPANFGVSLAACENEQLYEMLAMKEDYVPEAIEAACAELRSRHLPPETEAQMQHAAATKIAAQKQVQDLPLRPFQKVLLLIFSGGPLSFIFIVYFSVRNQTRRVFESWPWIGLGLSFWVSWGIFRGLLGSALVGMVLGIGCASVVYYMLVRPSDQEQKSERYSPRFRPEPCMAPVLTASHAASRFPRTRASAHTVAGHNQVRAASTQI